MSARSYRKPRNCKTQSSLAARGPDWGEQPDTPCALAPGRAAACREVAGLLACSHSQAAPVGVHRAVLLPSHQTWYLLCSSALGPSAQALSRSRAPELFPWWGHRILARDPPCLCSAALCPSCFQSPPGCWLGRCLANGPETTSGGRCLGFSAGKVTPKELSDCQARATLGFPLSVCLLTVTSGVCVPESPGVPASVRMRVKGGEGVLESL